MMRPWLILPVTAFAIAFFSYDLWNEKKDAWRVPEAKVPSVPEVGDTLLPITFTQIQEARERPVMWSSRRVRKVVVKDTRQLDEFMQSRLLSVLESGNLLIATLRRKDGGVIRVARDTAPWRILSFDGRLAVFSGPDGQSANLILDAARSR